MACSSVKKKILFVPTSLSLHTRARGVAPGPNPGRRFTLPRSSTGLGLLWYGHGPHGVYALHPRDMDILPCTSPPALLTELARQVFALTFPRVLGRGPRAVRKTLVGVCLDSCVNLDL